MNAGRALRVLRAIKGLQQRDVAERAKLDQSYVSLIEAGKRSASPEAISTLARALGVSVPVFELLGADDADLKGISASQARELGRALAMAATSKGR
ncbi:MAG: helix-turn-helix domain-containing protein [Thermoanaerobaculia bacterium]|nr:helix-turn-helix domain-containing protein [Thermoanaerobaculia bacterium]